MSSFNLWWLPWTIALSGAGLVAVWFAWRRKDRAAAVRRLGWALLPWAALLLGLFGLVFRVVDAITDWLARFAFNPAAWLGVMVATIALGLIMLGGRFGRRASETPKQPRALARRSRSDHDDMADVEAILRKRGIR